MKTVPAEDELKFTYIVHTSLDVVEERLNSTSRNTGDMRELYLGQLYPTEDYKVYPFPFFLGCCCALVSLIACILVDVGNGV